AVGTITVAPTFPTLLKSARSGSLAEADAVLESIPACVGWKVILTVALPPLVSVPRAQMTAAPLLVAVPCEEEAEMNRAFAGRGLVMRTPVADAGPWFVATSVNVMLFPTTMGLGAAVIPSATSIEPLSMQQEGTKVVTFKVQPPAMFPEKPAVSSKT